MASAWIERATWESGHRVGGLIEAESREKTKTGQTLMNRLRGQRQQQLVEVFQYLVGEWVGCIGDGAPRPIPWEPRVLPVLGVRSHH